MFQTKLLSRLSHKVCRLLSSPIPLRKLPIRKANLSGFKSRDSGIGVQGKLHRCCDGSYRGMERISAEEDEDFFILLTIMKYAVKTLTTKNDNPEST